MSNLDFLVTDDVVETLENRLDYDLTPQERAEINKLASKYFKEEMPEVVPEGMDYTFVDAADCIQWAEKEMDPEVSVVSIDNAYFPKDSETFNVIEFGLTRETDPATGKEVLATRDPYMDYERRLKQIAAGNDSVQVFDVGALTGETLQQVTEDLENYGVEVIQTVIPIVSQRALETDFDPVFMSFYEFGKWLEGRDVAAIDGRKVPAEQRRVQPRTFIPYYQDPQEIATIGNENPENAQKFEEISRQFNEEVEEIVGEEVGNRVEAEW
jgi:hypothetical protein